MTDSGFTPADAAGLAAWFARAEWHATRLRRRLATLGGGMVGPCAGTRATGAEIWPYSAGNGMDCWGVFGPSREKPLYRPEIGAAGICAESETFT